MFTKKQVTHTTDMLQIFMISIGSLELAMSDSSVLQRAAVHPSMISLAEQLLSELIITICNTTAYRRGTVGSSHNALTSTAVAPLMLQTDSIKQVAKFLSSIKLVVKWLKTRNSKDPSSIEFLGDNAWKALGDALNALSIVIGGATNDLSVPPFAEEVLCEDIDLATFTPVTPTLQAASKDEIIVNKGGDEARSVGGMDGGDSPISAKSATKQIDGDADPVNLMLRLICGERHSDEEESIVRIRQIVHAARDLCKVSAFSYGWFFW